MQSPQKSCGDRSAGSDWAVVRMHLSRVRVLPVSNRARHAPGAPRFRRGRRALCHWPSQSLLLALLRFSAGHSEPSLRPLEPVAFIRAEKFGRLHHSVSQVDPHWTTSVFRVSFDDAPRFTSASSCWINGLIRWRRACAWAPWSQSLPRTRTERTPLVSSVISMENDPLGTVASYFLNGG